MSSDNAQGQTMTFTGAPGGWFGEGTAIEARAYRYNIQALRKSVVAACPLTRFTGCSTTHRVQPVRDAPAQRTAGTVHCRARD